MAEPMTTRCNSFKTSYKSGALQYSVSILQLFFEMCFLGVAPWRSPLPPSLPAITTAAPLTTTPTRVTTTLLPEWQNK